MAMRIAYVIGAHSKERQFKWIFDAIYNPHDLFAIHIDSKTPALTALAMRETVANRPNVFLIPPRSVVHSEWSLCNVELDAIKYFCERHEDWQYFINLSGQDYPLKSRDQIGAELGKDPRQNYLEFVPLNTLPPNFHRRKNWYNFRIGNRLIRTPLPHFTPKNIRIDWHGSAWHVITREFCEWLLKANVAQECMRFLRHAKNADEFLMQTLIMNSPFADTLNTSFKWWIRWGHRAPHPDILTMAHYDELTACDEFFARKFDETIDSEILYALARHIGAQPVRAVTGSSKQ